MLLAAQVLEQAVLAVLGPHMVRLDRLVAQVQTATHQMEAVVQVVEPLEQP